MGQYQSQQAPPGTISDEELRSILHEHNIANHTDTRTRSSTILLEKRIVRQSGYHTCIADCLYEIDIKKDSQLFQEAVNGYDPSQIADGECTFTPIESDPRFTMMRIHKRADQFEVSLYSVRNENLYFGSQLEFDRGIRQLLASKE